MDAIEWLRGRSLPGDHAVLTSMPDASEVRSMDIAQWQSWFIDTAELVVRSVHEHSAAIFYQTDVHRDGRWVDKAFLVQLGARAAGAGLLWHKIVCRAPAGTVTRGRPGYAHLLCFSRALTMRPEDATADVLPQLGRMTWPRAMGLAAVEAAVHWLAESARASVVVDPFCGVGTALAIANRYGLDAIGIERSTTRAARARELVL